MRYTLSDTVDDTSPSDPPSATAIPRCRVVMAAGDYLHVTVRSGGIRVVREAICPTIMVIIVVLGHCLDWQGK